MGSVFLTISISAITLLYYASDDAIPYRWSRVVV